jgi:hypothetical protein
MAIVRTLRTVNAKVFRDFEGAMPGDDVMTKLYGECINVLSSPFRYFRC